MKTIITSLLLLLVGNIYGQDYVDEFNSSINTIDSAPSGFIVNIVNEALQIEGDGSGTMWASLNYNLHEAGTNTTIDISSSPKLYIRAKTNNPLEFRVDLRDHNGFVTNQSPISVDLTNNYKIYEFDYTGKLIDGAYGGPCTSGPCVVDSSKISGLSIFAEPGVGGYNGIIDIDWISLGATYNGGVTTPNHSIRLNQVGYFTNREKIISVNSSTDFSQLNYTIKNNTNTVIKSGKTGATKLWEDAQEYVTHIDASDINIAGKYSIEIEGAEESFNVGDDVYEKLAQAVFKYYYFNRASTEITSTHGENWARPSGILDTSVRVHASAATNARPEGTIISASKGWYDAGDYNKYIVNSGISTYSLLSAFENYELYYKTKEFNIPESGNTLPDILDEILWNLEWMLAMQDPNDGGVYHKLTGLNFSGIVMPEAYNFDRYVVKKSTSAALNFAAVTALASRVFKAYEAEKPDFSTQLLDAAKKAYAWARANPSDYFTNPPDVKTGQYDDTNVSDEFQWAASELFITTKESQYKNDIQINSISTTIPSWQDVGSLALFSINKYANDISSDIDVVQARKMMLDTADKIRNKVNVSPMKIGMETSDYVWGSNGVAGNQVLYLIKAYEISNDETYLEAAYTAMDYLLGRNGVDISFITGFGSTATFKPHHRISEADGVNKPVPGMVAGGPQPGQQDGCSYASNQPAKSYSDTWCSYASNEVTINWNAPLVYAINALQYYQNQNAILSLTTEGNQLKNALILYPNPSNGEVHITGTTARISSISIYTSTGKQVLTANDSDIINVNGLKNGTYIVRIKTSRGAIIKKMIKK